MGSPPPTGHRLPLQTSLAEWQSSWGCPREPRYPTAPAGGWTSALLPQRRDHQCCWVPAEQCPRVTTARSCNSQGAPRCRRGQELLFSMGRGWDKSEEARLLGRRALFRAQVAREDCSSSSCVKAQRALAPPLLKLGEHFLENIPIVLRSPPLPSPFCERSTCSGSRPKDGAEGRCCQVRRLSLQLQLSRCSS